MFGNIWKGSTLSRRRSNNPGLGGLCPPPWLWNLCQLATCIIFTESWRIGVFKSSLTDFDCHENWIKTESHPNTIGKTFLCVHYLARLPASNPTALIWDKLWVKMKRAAANLAVWTVVPWQRHHSQSLVRTQNSKQSAKSCRACTGEEPLTLPGFNVGSGGGGWESCRRIILPPLAASK